MGLPADNDDDDDDYEEDDGAVADKKLSVDTDSEERSQP